MRFEAIIFDCDGTLVDSEVLGNRVLVQCVAELGLEISLEEAVAQFTGGKMADAVAAVERRLGRPVPASFVPELRRRMALAFQEELQAVEGVESILQNLTAPFCVASSGPREKMDVTLSVTGLLPYFQDRIFSAYEVGCWKPDPGLFLHAARALGVAPERCAVVEDSLPGIKAGKAAGMAVFGYAPSGNGERFAALGARTFSHMSALLPLLCGEL
jgi:HAD superfamily hydrolase (TIGR01509 family)